MRELVLSQVEFQNKGKKVCETLEWQGMIILQLEKQEELEVQTQR